MTDRHRPLLPAQPQTRKPGESSGSATEGGTPASPTLARKRKAVRVACDACRKRKERCNGEHPICGSCMGRRTECIYTLIGRDEFVFKSRHGALQMENEQWRELYGLLRRLPEDVARQAFARIRDADDPITVLNFATSVSVLADPPAPRPGPSSTGWDPRVDTLNLKALSESPIRVHARPWTAIAGDGLVSQLISSFFIWDDAFFCGFIDREAFLGDMRSGDPKGAKYCSPFLVNTICASRCFTSARAKSFSAIAGIDVGVQFLDEAKKLLDLEHGRASLPSVQGLTLMFTLSAYRGSDRAGMMYRYAAYEMLRRLHLDRAFAKIKDDPEKARQRQIISKAQWGLFCFESIVAYVYLDLSLLPPPTVPRCFDRKEDTADNVDFMGKPHARDSETIPIVPGILDAACDLSELLYQTMLCNTQAKEVGTEEDLAKRHELYASVLEWKKNIPDRMKNDVNWTPQTCFLRVYTDEVLISILRPLSPDTVFEKELTVKDLCIRYSGLDTTLTEQYVHNFMLSDYSCMAMCGLYNTVLTIVRHLDDPTARGILVRASRILRGMVRDFPMAKYILQGVKAMAWALGFKVPPESRQYFESLGSGKEELQDVPLAFTLPPAASVRELLCAEDDGGSQTGIEMGLLLSKWSALSID